MSPPRSATRRSTAGAAGLLVLSAVAAGCSGDSEPAAERAVTSASTASAAPTLPTRPPSATSPGARPSRSPSGPAAKPRPRPRPTVTASPLSGRTAGQDTGRVVVVKIDNTEPARPQAGVEAADVVYVEPVESGLTRLAAVFSSYLPSRVGPVRSARASDPELLGQYGRVALAYSGASRVVQRIVTRAPLYAGTPAREPAAFRRTGTRPVPFNLYVSPAAVLRSAPGSAKARDIGFRFGTVPPGGSPAGGVLARWQRSSASFSWSPEARKWLVSMDGDPARSVSGRRYAATTVVVQYVQITTSTLRDSNGSRSPNIRTAGAGLAKVLRDGRSYDVRWSRRSFGGPTRFTLLNGRPMTFAPGQVWVVLLDRRTRATIR